MGSPDDKRHLSRREVFARLFKPVRAAASAFPVKPAPVPPPGVVAAADPFAPGPAMTGADGSPAGGAAAVPGPEPVGPVADLTRIAVIAGRHCLAYQGTGCSVCHDRCPVPGAIVLEQGLPRVEPAVCIGCNVCHDVCPAPDNAVRVVPRPPGLPRPAATGGGATPGQPDPNAAAPGATGAPPPAHSPFPSLAPRHDVEDV